MNKSIKISVFFLILILIIFNSFSIGQEYLGKADTSSGNKDTNQIINIIEGSIAKGNVEILIKYFSHQTYLSLSNGINGYYSTNQAYYVLEDFFVNHRVSAFKFSDMQIEDDNMYGTGTYLCAVKGKRSEEHVYISLKHIGKKWKITQLTIN